MRKPYYEALKEKKIPVVDLNEVQGTGYQIQIHTMSIAG